MRWKSRRSGITNTQYEVLNFLSRTRVGEYRPLEPRLERVAKQMVQGVHPWLKTMPAPQQDGTVLYAITSDGRSKWAVEKATRGE